MGSFRGVELDGLELTGPRLLLRPWRPDDAEAVCAAFQDPSQYPYQPPPQPYTLERARTFIRTRQEGRAAGRDLGCALVDRGSGRLVGSARLQLGGGAEVGYWVAPGARGYGYAAEALRTLTEWGFHVGVPRVRVACDVQNLPSVRTAMRAGFGYEGLARGAYQGGGTDGMPEQRGDDAVFARLPSDPGAPVPHAFPPLPPGGLTDGVIRLRVSAPGDAAGHVETEDPVSVQWGFTGHPPSEEESRAYVSRAGLQWLVGPMAALTMDDVSTGRYAGSLQLRRSGPPQIAGVGYSVHPQFRGRRYTARALRLIVPWAFERADIVRLEVGAKIGNVASQRAALSAGFEPEGVRLRRLRNADGSFADEARFVAVNPRYL